MARARQERDNGNPGAARHDLRPQRPGAGDEHAGGVRFIVNPHEGAGSRRRRARSWRASCTWTASSFTARSGRRIENHRGFLWIKRKVDSGRGAAPAQPATRMDRLSSGRASGIIRTDALAAHVLGSVDFEEKGNAGIEKALDEELRGKSRADAAADRREAPRHRFPAVHRSRARARRSRSRIDERLQFVAERELAAAVQSHARRQRQRGGDESVYRRHPGAWPAIPTYDPNLPPQPGDDHANRMNHAVSVPFEPGSVFKVITLSAALETTNLSPDSPINCHGGVLKLPGRVIHDSHLGHGSGPDGDGAREIEQHRSDRGRDAGRASRTCTTMSGGSASDRRPGSNLPAESAGKLRKLKRWGKTSLASIAMGQEVSVTTLQLAQAASVIANGGLLVRPRLVLKKGDQTVPPARPVRVVKPETAITMRQMMEGVVLHGTGTSARLEGYTVGGKTGSAQIFDRAAQHYTHTYNGSFMGFAPLTNPSDGGGGDAERDARRRRASAGRRRRRSSRRSRPKRCACSTFPRTFRKSCRRKTLVAKAKI